MPERYYSETTFRRSGTAPLLRSTSIARTIIFAVLNLSTFTLAAMFWHYTQTGRWLDFSAGSYRLALSMSLGHGLIYPLSIFSYPWMILVSGLMLSVVVFVPVMMAVLYRLFWAFAFVAVVGVFGHAPLLVCALALGCFLAARTPLRSDMPFVAFLLGMVPVAVYIYLFGFLVVGSLAVQPLQRGLAYSPFLLAIVASVLSSALVLLQARLMGYRYGAIYPVLLVLVFIPMAIFHTKVGADELEFSLIANRLAPGGADISAPIPLDEWKQKNNQHGLSGQRLVNAIDGHIKDITLKLIEDCDSFIKSRENSRRAAAMLWLAGQCSDLELNQPAIEQGYVIYSPGYPTSDSEKFWKKLVEDYPYEPQTAIAHWQIARLELRKILTPLIGHEGVSEHLRQARSNLAISEKLLMVVVAQIERQNAREHIDRVFLPPGSLPVEGEYSQALFNVRRLMWLIKANNIQELWDAAVESKDNLRIGRAAEQLFALAEYESLDRNQLDYRKTIEKLIERYEATNLADNLMLAHANASSDPFERTNALIALADVTPHTDAAIHACYELGILSSGTAASTAISLLPNLKTPSQYFDVVLKYPDNPWIDSAKERLKWLEK